MSGKNQTTSCPGGDNAGERVGGQRDAAVAAALAPNAGTPAPHKPTETPGMAKWREWNAKRAEIKALDHQRRRWRKTRRYLAGLAWWLIHSWRYRCVHGIRMRDFQ